MQEGWVGSWREAVPRRTAILLSVVARVGPVLDVLRTVVPGLLWEGYDPIRDTGASWVRWTARTSG